MQSVDISHSGSGSGSGEKSRHSGLPESKHRRQNIWQFVMSSAAYCVSYSSYNSMAQHERPSLLQYIVGSVGVGLPLFYTQTFLGQYQQMGMINFRYIMPVARGLMYSFALRVVAKTIRCGYALANVLMYFLMSFQAQLPWKKCPAKLRDLCSNHNNTTYYYPHPAYVFWRFIYADDPVLDVNKASLDVPSLYSIMGLLTYWMLVFAFVVAAQKRYRKITRGLFYAHFLILSVLLLTAGLTIGQDNAMYRFVLFKFRYWMNPQTWFGTVKWIICDYCIAELYVTYAGAQLHSKAPAGTISFACVSTIFLSNFMASCLSSICHGYLNNIFRIHIHIHTPYLGYGTGNILIVIPQGLSHIALPQFWSALFFLSCTCIILANQLLHLLSIVLTITEIYSNMLKYKTYILAGLCIFDFVVGGFIYSSKFHAVSKYILEESLDNATAAIVFIWSVIVYWIYGVTKLSDDIEFKTGNHPTKFWKIAWCVIPAVILASIICNMGFEQDWKTKYPIIDIIMLLILTGPTLFFLAFELLKSIKKKNLFSAFQSLMKWGPLDSDEKTYRSYYNPRGETKYHAKKITCKHNCLINSSVVKRVTQEEDRLRVEFFMKNGIVPRSLED